ncbi:MAG TPA: helix-turn-helix domain-containing protein [Jatrophihabitans sp.]|nr:helix-turn-helix domain-containing protein [Jatrophihabitans sp.]
MDFTDPSKQSALVALLDQLPVGAPVGLATGDESGAELHTAPAHPGAPEILLGVGLDHRATRALLASLGPDVTLVVDAALVLDEHVQDEHVLDEQVLVLDELMPDELRVAGGRVVLKPAAVSWRSLHAALVAPRLQVDDDLADLAQTIATLTGGLVTIEDTASRVLAYSRSSDEVDELRRLSILGRSGPPEYLALLREWGIYDRLATPDDVVEIAEHPASGVRRRLAVGVFAGPRQLGTIWVQQGRSEFGPHAAEALLGAARLTAAQLVGLRPRPERLADLISGRASTDSLGADANRPAALAVLELAPSGTDDAPDTVAAQEKLAQLAATARVHAAGLRRRALVERIGDQIVILLPALAELDAAEAMLGQAVTAARQVTGCEIRAGLGLPARTPRQAAESLRQAARAVRAGGSGPVHRFDRVRHRLLVTAAGNWLAQQADLLDPAIAELIAGDPEAAGTLLRYLDTGSDVSRVAREMEIHPTTVRYRVRKVSHTAQLDLTDPDDRLSVQLQLRYGLARER